MKKILKLLLKIFQKCFDRGLIEKLDIQREVQNFAIYNLTDVKRNSN